MRYIDDLRARFNLRVKAKGPLAAEEAVVVEKGKKGDITPTGVTGRRIRNDLDSARYMGHVCMVQGAAFLCHPCAVYHVVPLQPTSSPSCKRLGSIPFHIFWLSGRRSFGAAVLIICGAGCWSKWPQPKSYQKF